MFTQKSYERFGVFGDISRYESEFKSGFGSIEEGIKTCLEVGCGVSPYFDMLSRLGIEYEGCDSSRFACEWMAKTHGVRVYFGPFEKIKPRRNYDMILSAHFLEHVRDAESVLSKMNDLLVLGGLLYLLIPDDSDLHNQDHQWFFTKDSAVRLLELSGFVVESAEVRKIVERELFMYFVARKIN